MFEAKLRKIGNSLGVIIPSKILEELGYNRGDNVRMTILSLDMRTRNKHLSGLAGIDEGKSPFTREKRERY
ncbi:MAG: hypothetical protein ACE5QW_05880 [Thermoplasmata archaeon]